MKNRRQVAATKELRFRTQYPNHRSIIEGLDNANEFGRFGEEKYLERYQCLFIIVCLTKNELTIL